MVLYLSQEEIPRPDIWMTIRGEISMRITCKVVSACSANSFEYLNVCWGKPAFKMLVNSHVNDLSCNKALQEKAKTGINSNSFKTRQICKNRWFCTPHFCGLNPKLQVNLDLCKTGG